LFSIAFNFLLHTRYIFLTHTSEYIKVCLKYRLFLSCVATDEYHKLQKMFALYFRIFFILHFSSSYLEGNIFLLPSHTCFLALCVSVFCLSVSLFVCYSVSTCMYLCECLSICRSVFLSLFYGQFGLVHVILNENAVNFDA